MTIDFRPQPLEESKPRITVFGVGGAGGNAVNNMINGKLEGVDFVVANTDSQSLTGSLAEHRVQLGVNITNGLGAGARPDIGKVAAEEAVDDIQRYLDGNNMVFIAAGMGGGTGTGAAPVIARAAREQGILTVGVVTKPFQFEGVQRMRLAEAGIEELQAYVDTLIVIPNQNLFLIANENTGFADAFNMADDVLHAGVRGVTDLMISPGLINLDFADIRTVMGEMGKAMMGTGEAEGDQRALEAADKAIHNPLLDHASIEGAQGVLINITGGADMTLHEVDEAASRICREVDENANIIFGTSIDQELEGGMRVAVIATGIDAESIREPVPEVPDNVHVLGISATRSSSAGTTAESEATETADAPAEPAMTVDAPAASTPATSSTSVATTTGLTAPTDNTGDAAGQVVAEAPVEKVPAAPVGKSVSAAVAGGVTARSTVGPSKEPAASSPAAPVAPAVPAMPAKPTAEEQRKEAAFIPRAPVQPGETTRREPEKGANTMDAMSEAAVVNAGRSTKKRAPSLFERMTGTGRARQIEDEAPAKTTSTAARPPSKKAIAAPAPKAEVSSPPATREPTLDMAAKQPATPVAGTPASDEEDPLEIPAFLRRQAN